MNKNNIINLWKSVGWNNLDNYHEYLKFNSESIVLSELDPDKISPREFWIASDEHFFTDPVCNHTLNNRTLSIQEANKLNYNISLFTGMIGQTQGLISHLKTKMGYVRIAEIGCGYGSFYENFIAKDLQISYHGFDVIQRIEYAQVIKGHDGCFSDQQVEAYTDTFNLFFSSNTFQHLSRNQIKKYLTQVYAMLEHEGYFNVMYVDSDYSYHYGQKIELYSIQEFELLAKSLGFIVEGCCSKIIPNSLTPYSFILKK